MDIIDHALNNSDKNEAIVAVDDHLSTRFNEDPSALTQSEKDVVYVENLEREVNNGGFCQFFLNYSGQYAQQTVEALNRIGASITAKLLAEAINAFPDGKVPEEIDKRVELIDEIEDEADKVWDVLDDRFYEYEEDIASLVLDFIRSNRDKFN